MIEIVGKRECFALDERLRVATEEYASASKEAHKLFADWQKAERKADAANLIKTPELEACEVALAAARAKARAKYRALEAAEEDVREAAASGQDIFLRTFLLMREAGGLQQAPALKVPVTKTFEEILGEIQERKEECSQAHMRTVGAQALLQTALSERPENVRRTQETMEARELLWNVREAEKEAAQSLKEAEEDLFTWVAQRIQEAQEVPFPQDEILPACAARVLLDQPAKV